MKQVYLGQELWERRKKIFERKGLLRSHQDRSGSISARKKLRATRRKERNFVKNQIGEVARDIASLAIHYDADIAIERLTRFRPKGRRFNRQVMRIPFRLLRRILEGRCFDNRISLNMVDGWHTSKWCTRCGAVGRGHDRANYSLFRCKKCGYIANADRKASLAIAVRALLERNGRLDCVEFQISGKRVPVDGLIRRPSEIGGVQAVSPVLPIDGKPISFGHG